MSRQAGPQHSPIAPPRHLLPLAHSPTSTPPCLPADKCRELMAVNDPTRMLMVLHPSAKTILGANNLAFLHGPEHKAMRKSFVSLFTRKALSTYTQLQVWWSRVGGWVGVRLRHPVYAQGAAHLHAAAGAVGWVNGSGGRR